MTDRPNNSERQKDRQKAGHASPHPLAALPLLAIPLCVMLAVPPDVQAAEAPISLTQPQTVSVPVQIAEQGKTTRIIFSFPALTAYTAHKQGDGSILFNFRTPATFAAPAGKSQSVLAFNATRPDPDSTAVALKIADGASYKHYRLQKRVVVEINDPNAIAKAGDQKAPAKPPADTVAVSKQEKTAVKDTSRMPAAPAPAVEKAQAAESGKNKPASTLPDNVLIDNVPSPSAAVTDSSLQAAAQMPQDNTPTHIALSTLEPARIAVFRRFNSLWVVLDSSLSGAQLPEVTGPLAPLMDKPKIVKLDKSTAFRYQLPTKNYFSVRKQNIGWDISVTPYPLQGLSDQQANLEFEGDKAKLVIPLKGAGRVIEMQDPDVGDKFYIVPANQSDTRIDQGRSFPNIEIIPAAAGLVLRPESDDIKINRIEDFVLVTSDRGILATPAISAGPAMVFDTSSPDPADQRRLFDFPNWRQGGLARLSQNAAMLEQQIAIADNPESRSEMIMKLALLYFANNMGQEALGALRILETDYPDMAKNPNFIALRGAANAMAGHYDEAMQDLSTPALQQHPEVKLWMGYAAAATEQWHMANQSFPKENQLLVQYPENIAVPITIYMAESALRLGRAQTAEDLLDTLNMMETAKEPHYSAAIAYLRGEIARQEGRNDDAIRIWHDVASDLDRLYHTKASLALANLEYQEKKISLQDAIDRIDSLRFAWRGDGLEVQIMHNLGLLKARAGKYLEGLQDMRTASKLAASMNSDDEPINNDMMQTFADIFSGDGAKISPIEAVSVYNEFGSMIPPAEAGAAMRLHAADFMISIDLLEKAEDILEKTLADGFVAPDKIAATGGKLAAVYLVDGRPAQALSALDKTASSAMDDKEKEKRALLRARALSQMNQVDEATAVLKPYNSDDAQRLKVDMLWKAQKWKDAADALGTLLPDPKAETLTPADADIVINTAVACKLANETACLKNLKNQFGRQIAATKQGTTFGVVTRDGGMSSLADRETIVKIAGETDMFKQFLDSYKSSDVVDDDAPAPSTGTDPSAPANPEAGTAEPPAATPPAE